MAKKLPAITEELKTFIKNQKIFFVGTAMAEGRVNKDGKIVRWSDYFDVNGLATQIAEGDGEEEAEEAAEGE